MVLKRSLIALVLLFSFAKTQAQKFELGKVSIEELQEKVHPKDTAAIAAILFKKGEIKYEYDQDNGFSIFPLTKL